MAHPLELTRRRALTAGLMGAGGLLAAGCEPARIPPYEEPQGEYYYALLRLHMSYGELLASSQDVRESRVVSDEMGNAKRLLVLLKDGRLYRSFLSRETNQFSPFVRTSQGQAVIPVPYSFDVSRDGNVVLLAGEERRERSFLKLSLDGGESWETLSVLPNDAAWARVLVIPGTHRFLVNVTNRRRELRNPSHYVVSVDPRTKKKQIQPFFLPIFGQPNPEKDILILPQKTPSIIEVVSVGEESGVRVDSINYETGEVSNRNVNPEVLKAVGLASYVDEKGHTHIITSSEYRSILYDADIDNRNPNAITPIRYDVWLGAKEGQKLRASGIALRAFFVAPDLYGRNFLFFAGEYRGPWGARRLLLGSYPLGEKQPVTFYNKIPRLVSFFDAKDMSPELFLIGETSGIYFTIPGFGKAFLPLTFDGQLDPNVSLLYPNRGLGK